MADDGKTTIVETGNGGGGGGAIALLAIAIIAIAVVLFLVFGQGLLSNSKTVDANVKIDTPAK
ncbi:MAG: hypothetical protein E7773_12580 [Sphingomonas sp.]|uniref:hypothetical protein n=1 Tax=Sphingomonas sp. TaxID=28214 RepID=UPI001215BED7|nr:hypothetical protein [Sphingomonas sp.]THD35275.1 MAG: hypothetical protein E7773_12580 [Sphingomonas sp.]